MFVGAETVVHAGFEAACGRLEELARDGWLLGVSGEAHTGWSRSLARVGPTGAVPGLSRLVEVRIRDLAIRGEVAVLVLRWEATGPAGGLFPELDADIALSRYGQSQTLLALTGAYRPPLGPLGTALDRVALRRVATATIQHFVRQLGDALADPPGASIQERSREPGTRHQADAGYVTDFPGEAGEALA
jgi:hypothetical protein